MSTRFKAGDIVLIVGLVLIAAAFILWNTIGSGTDKKLTAVITRNGAMIEQINLNDLHEPECIYLNTSFHQVILAEKGRIRFAESDCPNQTCVKTGWLTKAGDKAVCIPSQVVIKIVGESREVDVFAY